jgi:hypothetical protein
VEVQKVQGEVHRVGGKESALGMVSPALSPAFDLVLEVPAARQAPVVEGGMCQTYLERNHEKIGDWKQVSLVAPEELALPWVLDRVSTVQRAGVIQLL